MEVNHGHEDIWRTWGGEKSIVWCSAWPVALDAYIKYGGGVSIISPELSQYYTSAALPFVCWSFSNDKWPDIKLSVAYPPAPALLSQ